MSTALVTGAAGFIGRHLLAALEARGVQRRVLARDAQRLCGKGLQALPPDLGLTSSEERWAGHLEGVDVIYHLAGVAHRAAAPEQLREANERSPAVLARAALRAGVRRFVWLSSIKALGDVSSAPLTERAPYAPGDAYGASKMRGEQALLALGDDARVSIVRPPLVYGPGVKANFLSLLGLARLAGRGVPLPLGAARAPRSVLGVANLCDFLLRLAAEGKGAAGDGILHVADAESLSVRQLLELLNEGQRLRLWPVPRQVLAPLFAVAGRAGAYERLFRPLELDCGATRARLGWQPPFSSAELLAETMAWYRRR